MGVSLLVVNYNTKDLIQRLVHVLNAEYEPGVWKLHIIDNGSTDGSKEILDRMFAIPELHIDSLTHGENVGYAKAINRLSHMDNEEYLCAVNADTWFSTRHVKQVIESFKEKPNAAVIGVKQMDEQARIRHGGIFWDKQSRPVHRGWSEMDPLDAKYKDAKQCWTVSGSIYYMRRDVWNEVYEDPTYKEIAPEAEGAFLPTPFYFEETFFSQVVQHKGYEVWYDGIIETAGHTWNASTGKTHDDRLRSLFTESRGIYMRACDLFGIEHECKDARV